MRALSHAGKHKCMLARNMLKEMYQRVNNARHVVANRPGIQYFPFPSFQMLEMVHPAGLNAQFQD